ncbi:hypothetical protein Glove_248g25 [Diversispora epigaea]|uniref:BED-type domain-containing protein n=1 Tax=Diversispora epigaea TaxID=1348612 RepID=A0A397IDZ8_9GLOM|nr:hypothetical protein Glove_248g25 [Diversispora epigaea]
MSNESSIYYLIPPIDDIFQSNLSFDSETSLHREQYITIGTKSSLINEQDTATTSFIIHEQEIEIESNNSYAKSKVWDYFTKPYGPSKSRKTKCHECGREFSYHGSPTTLKYHLKNKHKIDISNNLSQVKRQSQQIPSQQSIFSSYSEPSFLSVDENSLLQSNTISLVMSTNSGHQIHETRNQPLNLQLLNSEQNNADILTAEEGFFTVLDKLLKINRNDKGNKDALIIRGKFYQKMGEYEESIEDCNRALEIEPNNVNALVVRGRGKTYSRIYKYEESITDLSKAIEIEPNNVDALISRGDAYIEIGKYEESIADLSRALEIESNNVEALISRGESYSKMHKYEKSIADLCTALEIEPKNVNALVVRGKTYSRTNKYEESIADLNSALKIEPNNVIALKNQGKNYSLIGKYEESIAYFSRVLEIESDDVDVLINRGEAYAEIDKYEESIADFSRAIEIEPDNEDALISREEAIKKWQISISNL